MLERGATFFMETVTIRDAELDDIAAILRVTERSWNAAYGGILLQETIETTMAELHEGDVTRQLIEREDVAYFVAERGESVLGYSSGALSDAENVAQLGALHVDPDYWNEGVGTALLQKFEEFCHQRDEEAIRLHVLSENEIGMSFYRKHDYTVVDERETERFGEPTVECVFPSEVT